MTLLPTRTFRWAYPVILIALAAGGFWSATQDLIHGTPPDAVPRWFPLVFAVPFVGLAILCNRGLYVRVDDSMITFAPTLLGNHRFARQDVARIEGIRSGFYGRAALIRTDGSRLWSTGGAVWGRAGLQSLANYLGVPFAGAEFVRSYWDFGRWS